MITINRLLKIVGIFIVSIIFLVIITVVVAKIYEDKLAAFTIEKLENQINAPMSVGKVSLIPLFSFPRISAEINKLYIGDPQSRYNDTLFFINSLKIGLDSWDLINGIYTIDEMEISGLDFDYEVDSAGKSNIDFIVNAFYDSNTETESDTLTSPLDLSADKLKLENIHIKYYDSLNNIGSEVAIPEITIRAKTKNNIYSAKTKGSFVLSHILFKDTRLDKMESCNISFDLEYENNEAVIKKLLLKSEGIKLGIKGTYLDSDTAKLNTKIEAKDLDFDILKRYLPKQYDYFIEDARLAEMETLSIDMELDYVYNIVDLKRL